MGCFDECLSGMMEPYGGNIPLFSADKTDATVTIVQESYDDGMKVTRIQTPPRTNSNDLMSAINNILGIFGQECPSLDKDGQKMDKSSDKEGDDKSADIQSNAKQSENGDDSGDKFGKQGRFGQADKSDGVADEKESVDKF